MSCATRNASRESPSRKLPAIASRGAKPIACLAGEAATCDAHHMTAPHPDGLGASDALLLALADAALAPDDVDFVNAHGTGTPLNDASEAAALKAVFGDRVGAIPVTSTKSLIPRYTLHLFPPR